MLCARAALKRALSRAYGSSATSPQKGDRVVVGMSGGIDSSVSAKLLAAQDYDLSAVFMRNWDTRDEYGTSDNGTGCEWEKDWDDVQRVCKAYDIPCEMVDLSRDYWNRVFEPSLREWEDGVTPNPDVWCNREIKFGALLKHLPAPESGGKPPWLATGHYARKDWHSSRPRLLRSLDPLKDQTYYLSSIPEAGLARALFPLGELTKNKVREIAHDGVMPTSVLERAESMGLCFIGQKKRTNFKDFISSYIQPSPGPVKLLSTGKTLTQHHGLWTFTIGENIRLPGQAEKLFVIAKDVPNNTIFVGPAHDPNLLIQTVHVNDFSWIWRADPPEGLDRPEGVRLLTQIRHKMVPLGCTVRSVDDSPQKLAIEFDEPLKGVAPGQVAALWSDEWCLGCGVIARTGLGTEEG
uniref:tRNA-5-taurinomethyluridine 2-sulfurtransferase n=1 Tax=Mycena chlorophos TaxID=658473 RepID=A0ABQ0L2C2_MYCCL|nr:5-methylaminomethyl-2-thiouridylate-methyltransferase [Mycena chlorophos]